MTKDITVLGGTDELDDSRVPINNNFQYIAECFSDGTGAPTTPFKYMLWVYDNNPTAETLRIRNRANTAWIDIGDATQTNLGLLPKTGGTLTGALTLSADPTVALHAATKQYTDGHSVLATSAPTNTNVLWIDQTTALTGGAPNDRIRFIRKYNATNTRWDIAGQVLVIRMTNGSGAQRDAGDVVVMDTTNSQFDLAGSDNQQIPIFVCLETIADSGTGLVAIAGGPIVVNCTGTPTAGQYLRTANGVDTATATGTAGTGDFGFVLHANSTTPDCILYGFTR